MAKFKVLKRFRGIKEDKVYEVGQEIELTDARVKEINKKLKGYLEKVKEKPKKDKK